MQDKGDLTIVTPFLVDESRKQQLPIILQTLYDAGVYIPVARLFALISDIGDICGTLVLYYTSDRVGVMLFDTSPQVIYHQGVSSKIIIETHKIGGTVASQALLDNIISKCLESHGLRLSASLVNQPKARANTMQMPMANTFRRV